MSAETNAISAQLEAGAGAELGNSKLLLSHPENVKDSAPPQLMVGSVKIKLTQLSWVELSLPIKN